MNILLCVTNEGFEDLEPRKVYQLIEDKRAAAANMVRVVDESGEDYLYPANLFQPIQITRDIEHKLFKKAA
jgi:hypothetical protein